MLTRPGRLDRRVQGQKVGLVGDASDRSNDVADAGGLSFEFEDHRHGRRLPIGRRSDAGDTGRDLLRKISHEEAERIGLLARCFGGVLSLRQGCRDGGDGTARFFRSTRRLFGAGSDQFHGLAQFLCGRGRLADAAGQFSRGRGDTLSSLLLSGMRTNRLAAFVGEARQTPYRGDLRTPHKRVGASRERSFFHQCHYWLHGLPRRATLDVGGMFDDQR